MRCSPNSKNEECWTGSPKGGRSLRVIQSTLLHGGTRSILRLILSAAFYLQNTEFREWAMLVSNQRPLPCECEGAASYAFAGVQELPQIAAFASKMFRDRPPPFARVGVLLV